MPNTFDNEHFSEMYACWVLLKKALTAYSLEELLSFLTVQNFSRELSLIVSEIARKRGREKNAS